MTAWQPARRAKIAGAMARVPPVRYARSAGVNIAYQVVGSGPIDLVMTLGWVSHLEILWELPAQRRFLERLAGFSRLILFDKRGTGLSDRSRSTSCPAWRCAWTTSGPSWTRPARRGPP